MQHPSIAVLASNKRPPLAQTGAPTWGFTLTDLSPIAVGGVGAAYCLFTKRWLGAGALAVAGVGATLLRVPDAVLSSIDPCYKGRDASGKCWATPSNNPPSPQIATPPAPVK